MKILSRIYNVLIFSFLYAPIVVLIIYSFNDSKNRVKWGGFTLDWYKELFNNDLVMESLRLTLQIAVLAAVAAMVMGKVGILGALGVFAAVWLGLALLVGLVIGFFLPAGLAPSPKAMI